ncbi:MAG TPA: hypothetical protein VF801_07355 [Rhodocyclaceae bacterium]
MTAQDSRTRVIILTDAYRIKGYIDLLPGARITDFMHEAREFLAVTDAEVYEIELGGRQVLAAPFLNVNRSHIQIVTEA